MKEVKKDNSFFNDAMKGVERIAYTKTAPYSAKIPLPRKKRPSQDDTIPSSPFSDYDTLHPVSADEVLYFFRSGIQTKRIHTIRAGLCPIEATLDLHGMMVEAAREILHRFLLHCLDRGIRIVLIIHGKGRSHTHPILKNKLNLWLRQSPDILGFCSAAPKHGAKGAVYVLLKKNESNSTMATY